MEVEFEEEVEVEVECPHCKIPFVTMVLARGMTYVEPDDNRYGR